MLTALCGSIALSATAAPLIENKAALPKQCTQLFKETENLIAKRKTSLALTLKLVKSKANSIKVNSKFLKWN